LAAQNSMTRATNRLTAIKIKATEAGKLQDGGGLILDKTATGGKWIYRYRFAGQRREMGLGSFPGVTLADARKARDRWATALADGKDPITERKRLLADEKAALDRKDPTLFEITATVFDALKGKLRGEGTRGRWRSPLDTHVLPKIGKRRLSDLHQTDIHDAIKPIWTAKNATAEKAMQRLGIIFRNAKLMGYDCDPFTIDAARYMLGEVIREPVGIVHTPWREVPALFQRLGGGSAGHQCLRMIILTAARSDSVRGMRFSEIDGDVWTVPADRMKGRAGKVQPFRVPLSPAALEVVRECAETAQDDYLFPSYRQGACISQTAILKALNAVNEAGRPHGFRSSFREWVQDTNACSYDVAETVLAHAVGGKVERTYARSDLLDARRVVMGKWADHVTGEATKVVRLRG
jgi:integrase